MIIDKECGFYNEEKGDEYAPARCDDCYRFQICKDVFMKEINEKYALEMKNGKLFNNTPINIYDKEAFHQFLIDMNTYLQLQGIDKCSLHVNIVPVLAELSLTKRMEEMINEVIESEGWNEEEFWIDNLTFDVLQNDFTGDVINTIPIDEETDPQKLHEIFAERVVNMARDLGISCFVATDRASGSVFVNDSKMVECLKKDYLNNKRFIQHTDEDDVETPSFLDFHYVICDYVRKHKGLWSYQQLHKLGTGKSGIEYCFRIEGKITTSQDRRDLIISSINEPLIYLYYIHPVSFKPTPLLLFMFMPGVTIASSKIRIFVLSGDCILETVNIVDVHMYDSIFEDVNERTEDSWYNKIAKYLIVNQPTEFMIDLARDLSHIVSERF